jgi:hypothetical protein
MRKFFAAALLTLPLLALPARAGDPCNNGGQYSFGFGTGINFTLRSSCFGNLCCPGAGCGPQLGPWYNFWPMEAHFQTPAIPYYPYWPAAQALVPGGASSSLPLPPDCPQAIPTAAPAAAAPPRANATQPTFFRPVGYYAPAAYPGYTQVPSYWYNQ